MSGRRVLLVAAFLLLMFYLFATRILHVYPRLGTLGYE